MKRFRLKYLIMTAQREQRLFAAAELPALLRLSSDQIDRLVQTGQLRTIRICGEVRVTSNELDALVETYAQIERRKNPHVQSIQ
jgi:hypothetical protein